MRSVAVLGLVFALLATWRREVIALPPYYQSAMDVFRQAELLVESHFDYRRVRNDQAPGDDTGTEVDRTSVWPTALAILMKATPTPRAVFVVAHLVSFASAALIVVGMLRLLSPQTDSLYAGIVGAAAVTTPLVLAQVEMMGTDVLLTAFAVMASLAMVKARFGLAAVAATAAFLVTPWGMILTLANFAFSTVAFMLRSTPGRAAGARRIAGRGMAINLLAFTIQFAAYWGSGGPERLSGVTPTNDWISEIRYKCPDVGLLVAATLAVSVVALVGRLGQSSSASWGATAATTGDGLPRPIANNPLPLWSAMMVGGTLAAIYLHDRGVEIRHVVLLVPFVYLWLGSLVYRRSHPRLCLALPAVILLLNLANTNGRWFPTPDQHRRHGGLLQRSREYLVDLRSHLAAMHELSKAADSTPIVAAYPFTHYLSFPRLGYVDRPLAGYSAMPLRNTGFRNAVELFRDRPQRLVFVYCESVSHVLGQIASPLPAAGDRTIFDDKQSSPLVIFEKDLRPFGEEPSALDQWYIDHLWTANVAGAPYSLWTSRALYLASQGRSDLALRLLESRVSQAPQDLTTRLRLATMLVESGRSLCRDRRFSPGHRHGGARHSTSNSARRTAERGTAPATPRVVPARSSLPTGDPAVTEFVPSVAARPRPPLSWRKRVAFVVALALLLTITTFVAAELTVRALGYAPRTKARFNEVVEPGGSLYTVHPTLGCQMRPGHYRVTMGTGYSFSATHMANTLRVTALDDRPDHAAGRPEIWLLGDSFTYGYGVDDEYTFPWRLQAQMPDYKIINFGVPAYSTVQSLIQLRETLAKGRRPRAAVVLYFAEHDSRNTMLRGRRQIFHFWNRLGELTPPYARLVGGHLQVVTGERLYRPFPFVKQSAAINAVEQVFVEWEKLRSKVADHRVTEAVIQEMVQLCRPNNIKILVAGFSPEPETQELIEFCRRHDIAADNIQYDWKDPDNTNWPGDSWHASRLGYQRMADNLECTLKLNLLTDDYQARLSDPAQEAHVHYDLGAACLKLSRREATAARRESQLREAVDHLRAAVDLDSRQVDTRIRLADALALSGDRVTAIREYRLALEIDPESSSAALRLARLLVTAEGATDADRADALRLAEMVCRDPGDCDAEKLHVLALAQQLSGKLDQAQASACRALELATLRRQLGLAADIDRVLAAILRENPTAGHDAASQPVRRD